MHISRDKQYQQNIFFSYMNTKTCSGSLNLSIQFQCHNCIFVDILFLD